MDNRTILFRDLSGFPKNPDPVFEELEKICAALLEMPLPYQTVPGFNNKFKSLVKTYHDVSWCAQLGGHFDQLPRARDRQPYLLEFFNSLKRLLDEEILKEAHLQATAGRDEIEPFRVELSSFLSNYTNTLEELHIEAISRYVLPYYGALEVEKRIDDANYVLHDLRQKTVALEDLENRLDAKYTETATGKFAKLYEDFRKEVRTSRVAWLFVSVVSLILCSAVIFVSPAKFPYVQETQALLKEHFWVYALSQKVLLLSILGSFAVWSGKLYVSARHNEMILQHKETALKCMEQFVTAASQDHDIKNQVILEVTRSIFSTANVGIQGKADMDLPSSSVINSFTKIAGQGKTS